MAARKKPKRQTGPLRKPSSGGDRSAQGGVSGMTMAIGALIVVLLGGAGYFAFFANGGSGNAGSLADPGDAQLVALGEQVYGQYCASCHGRNLQGQANWQTPLPSGVLPAPPHDESGHTWHHPDELLFDYTKRGGQALIGNSGKSGMPGFGAVLSDREIWAVLAYIKSTWPREIRQRQAEITASAR